MKRRIGDVILVICLLLGLTYAARQSGIEERSGISVVAAEAYASGMDSVSVTETYAGAQPGAVTSENGAQGSTTETTGAAGTDVAVQSAGADVAVETGANAPAQSNGVTGTESAQPGVVAGENGTQENTTGTSDTAGTTETPAPTQTADAHTEGGVAEVLSAGKTVFGMSGQKGMPGSDGTVSGNGFDGTVSDGNGAADISGGDAVEGDAAVTDVSSGDAVEEDEYANLAIADVNKYVNVRKEPNTDSEIVGKIYSGAVAQILAVAGDNDDWFQIVSGSVEGYIKSEYFIYGDAALDVIDQYVTRYAKVQVARLNVRKEPTTDSKRIGYVDEGEKILLLEDCGDWLKVQYTDSKEGYVSAEYAEVVEEFVYAKSIEEERAELAAKQALAARETVSEQKAPESTTIVFPETSYTSNEELRRAIVDYALQYEGYRYVHGGRSLANGTDCSGFTCYIYADFGYSISRTPDGQYGKAGRAISYEEIQPGDIICYSSNGGKSCTHVALYIGDGKIIHAANSRKGVIIGRADYDTIIGIRNVID